jgi:NTP pyrophosphatase (non-canonical NTP hydrolase)
MFQLNLFKRKTAEEALELASWLRIEIGNLRLELKAKQAALARYEKTLCKLEEMLADLKQKYLFDDEKTKGSKK